MNTIITTGSNLNNYYFDKGERVFPCRCGETHRGDYAGYDYAHHNCNHDHWWFLDDDLPWTLICADCGKTSELLDTNHTRKVLNGAR